MEAENPTHKPSSCSTIIHILPPSHWHTTWRQQVPVVPEATSSQHITGRYAAVDEANVHETFSRLMSLPPLSLSYEEIVERWCQAIARVKDSMEEADADFEFYESEIVNIVGRKVYHHFLKEYLSALGKLRPS
ncbi:hypothetical protein BDN67DRAFT_1016238 [Paxillus ammoniavirescens]|nr:hypothetical protein BDN67DRAFT_1016238 [Paxillus ammoniavirescens]